ncbi:PEP-CTERM sorting domain-containing protein [Candidatus Thiodiazotropha endoloripes]|uniref:PEP-CTERM sorting domain-containing protein n=1 Tax=Candidatus Thiodiazotropha endoloripes TaxID=1818881 RepID=UPI000903E60D|nr:PEP-CTERM sorting domain-containing protein [Candidatus Thiodiazotropha endoloripes]
MKTQYILNILSLLLVSSFFNLAQATALYYTFESTGTFDSLGNGNPINEPVQYIFRVDGTHNSTLSRVSETGYQTYRMDFDATLLSGTGLEISKDQRDTTFGGYASYNPGRGYFELSLGLYAYGANAVLTLHPHIFNSSIPSEILTSYEAFTEWAVTNLYAYDHRLSIENPDSVQGRDDYQVTGQPIVLTSISEKSPTSVPEPETYLLFGLGLLVFNVIRRNKQLV